MKTIFLFSAWYPTRIKPLLGNFVENHAKALSLFAQVIVIHQFEAIDKNNSSFRIETTKNDAIIEIRVEYPKITKRGFFKKCERVYYFLRSYHYGIKEAISHYGKPNYCHVNVLTRSAIPALWLKFRYGIPYAITEHSTRYLPQKKQYNGFLRKLFTQFIVKHSTAISAVTTQLRDAMNQVGIHHSNFVIIPNVINTTLFSPNPLPHSPKTILHISGLTNQHKNITGMLRTIAKLSTERQDFKLILIGEGPDRVQMEHYASQLGIKDKFAFFKGEILNHEIPTYINNSDFQLLFSNYETQGLVLIESFACGKPVVATLTGGIIDTVPNYAGVLIQPNDEIALLEALHYLLDHCQEFDSQKIRQYAVDHYSQHIIGQKLYHLLSQDYNI